MTSKLEQCFDVLSGPTDEHKFAGLLMITKHIQNADIAALKTIRERVLATTGVLFFLRLLHTKGNHEEGISPYRALALNLISSFCDDEQLVHKFATESVVCDTIEALDAGSANANQVVVQDCQQIFQGLLAYSEPGREFLRKHDVVAKVIAAMSTCSAVQPLSESHELVLQHLVTLLHAFAIHDMIWPMMKQTDFEKLVFCFGSIESKSIAKVSLQELLVATPSHLWTTKVLKDVAKGLFGAWPEHSHKNSSRSDTTLCLIDRLLIHCGGSWLFTAEASGKLVVLVVQLAVIEAKLLLDEAERIWIDDRVNDAATIVNESSEDRIIHLLPVCYSILETVITILSGSSPPSSHPAPRWDELPAEALGQLKDALGQLFTVVVQFMTTVRDFLTKFSTSNNLDMVVYASSRVLGAWLAEESDFLQSEVISILPFLINYQPTLVDLEPILNEPDSDDEDNGQIIISSAPLDPLHFFLPGLLQLTAVEAGAMVILDDCPTLERILKFGVGLCTEMQEKDDEEEKTMALLTMCLGVSINLLMVGTPSLTAISHFQRTLRVYMTLVSLVKESVATSKVYNDDASGLLLHLVNYCLLVLLGSAKPTTNAYDAFDKSLKWVLSHPPSLEFESSYDMHELAVHLASRYHSVK
ncbi:hypothetical protein THRCLA_11538 [Thraustotheca clavata]|uniref:Neurochondrin n=1 Tax=Thraustotheca clavata TaxID=74557 RepID=A0A1V9Y7H7_9STRA|nr:hypothetical protein THRCLA_11538 [Thraustotheca clavata]